MKKITAIHLLVLTAFGMLVLTACGGGGYKRAEDAQDAGRECQASLQLARGVFGRLCGVPIEKLGRLHRRHAAHALVRLVFDAAAADGSPQSLL